MSADDFYLIENTPEYEVRQRDIHFYFAFSSLVFAFLLSSFWRVENGHFWLSDLFYPKLTTLPTVLFLDVGCA